MDVAYWKTMIDIRVVTIPSVWQEYGDDYIDTFGEENDGIDDVCDRSWSFFLSAAMTTLGVGVGHYYTSLPSSAVTITV
jgi:hypothetical protein